MSIPLLSTAFCVCSLETGAKIIAYYNLVILGFIVAVAVAVTSGLLEPEEFSNMADGIGIRVGALIFILLILLIPLIATIYLLLGVQKKRPEYMKFWIILHVLGLICSLLSLNPGGIVYFVIELYFTWIVYSHYTQLKHSQNSSIQHRPLSANLQGDVPQDLTPNAPPAYSFNQKGY